MTELRLTDIVERARAEAAREFSVAPESLVVLSAEAVAWPDGSLGCPQPGRMYTQALVPGYRVRLQGPSGPLDYHAGARGSLFRCPPERIRRPVPGAGRI